MGLVFARFGYLVVNISYRLAPKHPYPGGDRGHVPRVQLAARAHRRSSAAIPTRVAVAGESAGGNLITALDAARRASAAPSRGRATCSTPALVPRAALPFCALLEVSRPRAILASAGRCRAGSTECCATPRRRTSMATRRRPSSDDASSPIRCACSRSRSRASARSRTSIARCRRSSRRSARAIRCSTTRAGSKRRSRALDVPVRGAVLPRRHPCVPRAGLGSGGAPLLARCARVPRSPHAPRARSPAIVRSTVGRRVTAAQAQPRARPSPRRS